MNWKFFDIKIARILAKWQQMTDREREEQRKSFAYGNVKLSNDDITRETIEKVSEQETEWFKEI